MELLNTVKETFERQMHDGQEVISVSQFENVTNNRVFKVETECRPYIFKIYSSGWPEDGKLQFVARKLAEHAVPHAKIMAYQRSDERFQYGYLIEDCLPGTTADRLTMSIEETSMLFEKLAALVSRIHRIEMANYGYTGSGGPAMWTAFSEFMYDVLKDNIPGLTASLNISADELGKVNREIRAKLELCDAFPSVLCHGDLSAKNILVNSDDITLIDWDDAHSLCWMDDIALLTWLLKLEHSDDMAGLYRRAFLDSYEHDKDLFEQAEDILHVRHGLEHLVFYAGKPQYERVRTRLQESLERCGIEVKI